MLDRFESYFREIEMPDVLQTRANKLCKEFAPLLPGKVDRVFVTDGYDGEGARRYFSLWLMMGNVISECKNFAVWDNIDFMNLNCGVRLVDTVKEELGDLKSITTTKSKVRVQIILGDAASPNVVLQAAHNNCKQLINLVKDVFLTKLR